MLCDSESSKAAEGRSLVNLELYENGIVASNYGPVTFCWNESMRISCITFCQYPIGVFVMLHG